MGVVTAKVNPSMKSPNMAYELWIAVEPSGTIITAHCKLKEKHLVHSQDDMDWSQATPNSRPHSRREIINNLSHVGAEKVYNSAYLN